MLLLVVLGSISKQSVIIFFVSYPQRPVVLHKALPDVGLVTSYMKADVTILWVKWSWGLIEAR